MWILSCDGDCLGGRKVWLKPGKTYLFGRTTTATNPRNRFQVDNKSISRQHLTLSVSKLEIGDGAKLHKKPEIQVKDEGSKFLTELDGIKISKETKVLNRDAHALRLGNSREVFRIQWRPVVLSFSLTTKETKASNDPLSGYRNRIEAVGLDIKVSIAFIQESTTHVIAGKRNTAKGLSGLVNGRYIVSERFIDAVIASATSKDLDHEEENCQLEEDYEAHWPVELEYLPERSKETTQRPPADFLPRPERQHCFEGYTFVFCDADQFENLHAPIAYGGGKALHCATQPGQTTSEDIVRYVKRAAGETGLGEFDDGSTGKGVVVVRFRGKGQYATWAERLDTEVAQELDHRLIEQSEFLDAILANDASMLRKPLLPEDMDAVTQNGEARGISTQQVRKPSPTPAMTQRKREPVVSRFKGFHDDGDDDDIMGLSTQPPISGATVNGAKTSSLNTIGPSKSSDESDTLRTTSQPNRSQTQSTRKRPAPPIEDDEELVDRLVPQFAARKRQRLAEGHEDAVSKDPTPEPAARKPQRKPAKPPIDVKEKARERREAEAAAARRDEENIQEVLEGMTVEQMKSLAVVEEMDLQVRQKAQRHSTREGGDRWDPAWNGRKNFKKFRRQGEGNPRQRNTDRVIVSLEPVKVKGFGIGEEYWLERETVETEQRRRKKGRDRAAQSQSQVATSSNSRPSDHHVASVPSELLTETAGTLENTSGTVDLDAPRSTRGHERTQQSSALTNGSRSTGRGSQSQALSERHDARNQQMSNNPVVPPTRKRKKFAAASESDNSDEDDGRRGFRYTKRVR